MTVFLKNIGLSPMTNSDGLFHSLNYPPSIYLDWLGILQLLWHVSQGEQSLLLPYILTLPGLAFGVPTPRIGMLISDSTIQEFQYDPLIQDIQNHK
jgi:hypothetical protein